MLDINLIREQPEIVRAGMEKRGMDPSPVDEVIRLDSNWREILKEVESLKAERNKVSKEIGSMKDGRERQSKIDTMKEVTGRIKSLDDELRQVEESLNAVLVIIPNVPDARVPEGFSDEDNIEVRKWGKEPEFTFEPRAHWDLGPALDIIDFERGVKLSGTRFYILKGTGALLQRALIYFMLDLHIKQGYTEIYGPTLSYLSLKTIYTKTTKKISTCSLRRKFPSRVYIWMRFLKKSSSHCITRLIQPVLEGRR
jgi:seryl-tRNA synthetase